MTYRLFSDWLNHQRYRVEDSVGKLAHVQSKDESWPQVESLENLNAYMKADDRYKATGGTERALIEFLLVSGYILEVRIRG